MLNHAILAGIDFSDVPRFVGLEIGEQINTPGLNYLLIAQSGHYPPPTTLSGESVFGFNFTFKHWPSLVRHTHPAPAKAQPTHFALYPRSKIEGA
jgi:hypothetical protein